MYYTLEYIWTTEKWYMVKYFSTETQCIWDSVTYSTRVWIRAFRVEQYKVNTDQFENLTKKIWCWYFSASCCSTVAISSKVCSQWLTSAITSSLRIYVSPGTSTCKCILESHKPPFYPAKGQRRAALQSSWAHPKLQRGSELVPLPGLSGISNGLSRDHRGEQNETMRKR